MKAARERVTFQDNLEESAVQTIVALLFVAPLIVGAAAAPLVQGRDEKIAAWCGLGVIGFGMLLILTMRQA